MPESYSFIAPFSNTVPVGNFSYMPQVNFSGYTINQLSPAFTIGGWIRPTQLQQEIVVFASLYQFVLKIDSDGYLNAGFVSQPITWVKSAIAIADTNWHFAAVSFTPSQEGAGTLAVYLNGIQSQQPVTIATSVASTYPCVLGNNDDAFTTYLEVASWEVWNRALTTELLDVPMWGVPNINSPDRTGLVAAFDFASPQMTSSSPSVSFTSTGRGVMWPCLSMQNGYAIPEPQTGSIIGNSGPWSLLTWVKTPAASSGQFFIYSGGGVGEPGNRPSFDILVDMNSATQVIKVVSSFPPADPVILVSAPCVLSSWTHVAVTSNGQIIKLYVNGQLLASSDTTSFSNVFTSYGIGVSSDQPEGTWTGSLQSFSVWNLEITADQLPNNMGWLESDTAGLVSFFPLLMDGVDIVNGLTLTILGGSIINDLQITTGGTTVYQPADERLAAIANDIKQNFIVQQTDYWDIAAKEGITIPSRTLPEILAGEPGNGYSKLFASLSEPYRSEAIIRFDRDIQLGKALREKGIKTGRVESKIENGHTVFYYHTLNQGPVEVYREEFIITPLEAWIVAIVLDVLFVFFAMFGIMTAPATARTALTRGRRISRLFPQLTAALQNIPPGNSGAITIAGNVINVITQAGTLFSVIWDVITASWWDILFVVISLVASILSAIFLPASYGWRLANVGIAVATLAFDLTQKPQSAETRPAVA